MPADAQGCLIIGKDTRRGFIQEIKALAEKHGMEAVLYEDLPKDMSKTFDLSFSMKEDALAVNPPRKVRVAKTFKAARTPCPPVGTIGEVYADYGEYLGVRFALPMTDIRGEVWTHHFDNTDFMKLKFRPDEVENIKEEKKP